MVSRFDITETELIAPPNRFAAAPEPVPGAEPSRFGLPQTVINGSQALTSVLPAEGRLLADEIFALTEDPDAVQTDLINTAYWSEKLGMRFNDAFDLKETIGTRLFGTKDISRGQILQGIRQMEVERFRPPAFIAVEEPGMFSRMWHSIRDRVVTPRDIEGQIARGPFMALLLGREEFPDLEQLHRKTFKQSVKDAYEQSGNRLVKSLGGRAQLIGEVGIKLDRLLKANTPEAQQLQKDLAEWGEYMAMAADVWYAENPESQQQIQPGTGFLGTTAQYILHPENILQGSLETVPMLLSAVLGHITGTTIAGKVGFGAKFLPWAGRVAGIAEPEIGEEYTNARAQGLDVENALAQSYTKAYTRAVIEEWVLGERVKIFKGQFGRAASTGFAKKTTDLLLGGKRAYIRGAVEEGTQSVTDRFWEMVWGDSEEWFDEGFGGLFDQLTEGASEAAAVGGLLEMGMAGAFSVSGQVVAQAGRVDVKEQVKRINQIRKDIKRNDTLDDQSKEEIDVVLDEKVIEAEAAERPVTPTPEAAAAAVAAEVEPTRPVTPTEPTEALEIAKPPVTAEIEKAAIPEELEPLAEEARKFKTATQFVAAMKKKQFGSDAEVRAMNKALGATGFVDLEQKLIEFHNKIQAAAAIERRQAVIPGTKIQFDEVKAPEGQQKVQFFREGEQVHEIAVESAEEQIDVLEAHQAILAEKGEVVAAKPTKKKKKRVVVEVSEARIAEEAVRDKKIKDLQEDITELEKLQAENKKLEGTTQFDPEFDKFATKQIKKKSKEIEQLKISKPVEAVGQKTLGLTRAEIELLTPAQQKELRLEQARGVKVGFRAGEQAARERAKTEILKFVHAQEITESRRDAARELVMKFVPQELRGDFLFRVTKAKTAKDVRKIAATIEKGIARFERRDAIEDLREAARAINLKKMLPEFAKTAKSILDSIQIGKIRLDTMLRNSDLKEMAQQVLDTAREDSVAAVRAQQLLEELREKTTRTFAVNQLSVEAINQITDNLIALRFQNELDTIAAKDENATEAIRRRGEIKKDIVEPPDVPESLGGKAVKKFKLFHDNMESVLDAVSGARAGTYDLWKESKRATTEFVYDVLNKGVDDQIGHSEEARDIFRRILTDNNVTQRDILNWSMRPEDISKVKKAFDFGPKPQVHKFTLENARGKETEFEFTTNELMSIFMHFSNNHNLEVLLKDGIDRVVRGKKQKIRGFTIETLEEMVNTLTEQQKKVARQTGTKLMDGFNKDAINEKSVQLEFFELAKVDRYWPARRSLTRIIRGRKLAGTVKTVEGMGLLKERVGTGNPLKLAGFFETVYATNKNVSAYVGLAEPLREVKAVYSKETIEELENAGRGKEAELITDLIERFEGQSVLIGPLDTIIKRMLGGFAKAKLFLNVKIAPRQQISSFLISAYVDNKYIAEFRGLGTKEITEEINELSPQMKARFEQLQFDRDIGDAFIENELMNYLTDKTTLIDKTAIGMKFFDKNAIIDVYRATKAEVIDKNPGVNINSKEGKALLKDRFEWVVRHTQPMWHPKDRSLIGSDPRPLRRTLTMFMSQREQLVRMINNGVADFVNSKKTGEDATRLGRTLGTVALNMTAFTLYNFAWALLIQRKKRDLIDLGKFFLNDILSLPFFGRYIAKSFEITFNLLTDKPVFSRDFDEGPIEGVLGRILLEAIPNFALAGKHFVTKERYGRGHPLQGQDKWKNELLVAVDALVDAVSSLKGIPYSGPKDIIKSVKAQLPEKKRPGRKPL